MKKLSLLFIAFLFLQINLFAQLEFYNNHQHQKISSEQLTNNFNGNLDSLTLDSIIIAYKNTNSIPGIASLIVKNNQVIWNKNYGYRNVQSQLPVEDSTIFLISSISKTIVATAVMQLWENGAIDLGNNINNYLPSDFTVINQYYPNDSITVKMLLAHTSSIKDNMNLLWSLNVCGDSPIRLDSFLVKYLTPGGSYTNFYNYHPGQTYNYSNIGASLLALMVENLTGKSFDEYCRDSIFTPLSMNTTSWFLEGMNTNNIATPYYSYSSPICHQGGPYYPAVFLRTNKLELSHFLLAYINNGVYNNSRILDSTTIALIISDQLGYNTNDGSTVQGLIWFRFIPFGGSVWGHNGDWFGIETYIGFDPIENFGVVWFQNWSEATAPYIKLITVNSHFIKYAYLYGNIYAIRPSVNTNVRKDIDSILFRTNFSNIHHHPFTPYLIYSNSDTTEIDSLILFDDGLHGDLFSNDGTYGVYIPPRSSEDFYSLGVSTIDKQTNKYLHTPDICRFTTADPLTVDSIKYLKDYGDIYNIRVFVRNSNKTKTIKNATIKILTVDPWAFGKKELKLPDIPPDTTVGTLSWFSIAYNDSTFPGYFNLKFEIMSDGWVYWTDSIKVIVTGIDDSPIHPLVFNLKQNYPNPFNPSTKIKYSIPNYNGPLLGGVRGGLITLKVYDVLGREVTTLVNETKQPGEYEIEFNASTLSSGVYFYQLKVVPFGRQAGEFISTRKMILIK